MISQKDFLKHYEENEGIYWHILRQRIRAMRYDLEYGPDLDDLMQASLEKVIITFSKEGRIKKEYMYTSFKLAARNAVNEHIRSLNLFKGQPATGVPTPEPGEKIDPRFAGGGEVTAVSPDMYSSTDFFLDLEIILDPEEVKICKMLYKKYSIVEIAKKLGTYRKKIYRRIKKIREKLTNTGFKSA